MQTLKVNGNIQKLIIETEIICKTQNSLRIGGTHQHNYYLTHFKNSTLNLSLFIFFT